MTILDAIHRYAETGAGRVKPLSGEFEGVLRLRVGNHRVFFDGPPTPSPSTAFSTAKTLTAERRPAQNTADQKQIKHGSKADQGQIKMPFLLVDKTPKAKLRDGVF